MGSGRLRPFSRLAVIAGRSNVLHVIMSWQETFSPHYGPSNNMGFSFSKLQQMSDSRFPASSLDASW